MFKKIILIQLLISGFLTAQQPYTLPFASKDNSIELTVVNKSVQEVKEVLVQAEELPQWVKMNTNQYIIHSIKPEEEIVASFSFSVNKEAPVNKETILQFRIVSKAGETWKKEIAITVAPPDKFELYQNYPNPFNPVTTISYQVPANSNVTIKVYDVLGKETATLVKEMKEAGYYKVEWNAQGNASGTYVYQLIAKSSEGKEEIFRKKMMVVK